MLTENKKPGGLKGFLKRTGKFFFDGGILVLEHGFAMMKKGYKYGGDIAFGIASTSMIFFMPLLFEIAREGQVRLSEVLTGQIIYSI